MYDLDKAYTRSFFKMRPRLSWRIPIVCNAIITALHPHSVVDVGCGCGGYVKGFLDRGISACGIEGSKNCLDYLLVDKKYIKIRDIRYPRQLIIEPKRHIKLFSLALCLEVAEHIEEEFVDTFIHNLKHLSDEILMSAAPPGQGGLKHVNCQPKQYWIEKMAAGDNPYIYDKESTELVKSKFTHLYRREVLVYYNNLMFFKKEK